MMKLEIGKKYRTRRGWLATCVYTELNCGIDTVVMVHHMGDFGDRVINHNPDGAITSINTDYDIISEVSQWDEFEIDDPVMAYRESWNVLLPRHFAGVIDGIPHVFVEGYTSWTAGGATLSCHSVHRPTEEELKGGAA